MRIEFLGTGGAITIPQTGCGCRVCTQARAQGVPYSRMGPSLFIHGPDILIDTPEEIKVQLNRSTVSRLQACFYSHWHPDHVMGRRVWEMNHDWRNWPPRHRQTDIYLPEQVASDFKSRLGTWEHLAYFESAGLVRLIELKDGQTVEISNVRVRPFRLAEAYVYGFVLEEGAQRVLIIPDELKGWYPPSELCGVDLAVLPAGVFKRHPVTGHRMVPDSHPVLKAEATFEETLRVSRALSAKQVILTHIEEPDEVSHDDLLITQDGLRTEGLNVTFAYDTMIVEV